MKKKKDEVTVLSYFRREKKLLAVTTVTGLIYNIGLTAGPWFEGQLAQCLYDILKGLRTGRDMIFLALAYAVVIAVVQTARALKRLSVRKFANNISREMKESIYHHLVYENMAEVKKEDTGAIMTKAVSDADACAEGMRKFTTEIFDTGVVMIAYLVMLVKLSGKLTLMVILFPPLAFIAAQGLKKRVSSSVKDSRKAMSELNEESVDLAANALTYRTYGEETSRRNAYEKALDDYEKKNVRAGVLQNSPQPLYLVIASIGVMPVLWYGGKMVMAGTWAIASFSAFLSCYNRLAVKSSHAAKLFNAVQQAEVSWKRVKGYLNDNADTAEWPCAEPASLIMDHVSFQYEDGSFGLEDLNMEAHPGEIIGITGRTASGKSTFGRIFLNESPYEGRILYGGKDIRELHEMIFACTGHDPELFTGTVEENIAFGKADAARLRKVLQEVQIDGEVEADRKAGQQGSGLSGGQQARIALARALYSHAPVLILDDPFASVDEETERRIYAALREQEKDRIILIISHRLELFSEMDQVLYLENGHMERGNHDSLMKNREYARLVEEGRGKEAEA